MFRLSNVCFVTGAQIKIEAKLKETFVYVNTPLDHGIFWFIYFLSESVWVKFIWLLYQRFSLVSFTHKTNKQLLQVEEPETV